MKNWVSNYTRHWQQKNYNRFKYNEYFKIHNKKGYLNLRTSLTKDSALKLAEFTRMRVAITANYFIYYEQGFVIAGLKQDYGLIVKPA